VIDILEGQLKDNALLARVLANAATPRRRNPASLRTDLALYRVQNRIAATPRSSARDCRSGAGDSWVRGSREG
jgi:hypothetical protein